MRKIDLDAERDFENRKANGEAVRTKQSKYYWATQLHVEAHTKATIAAIKGKRVLEIGCASGVDAKTYSQYATQYVGVDISDAAIKNAQALGLSNAQFICVDGHNIPKPDAEFECVIVNSLLHHLDLDVTFREISRLLKDDGILIFREPLGTNPMFQLYRALTPAARTVDERPFTFADLKLMRQYFEMSDIKWYGFTCIFAAFLRFHSIRWALTKIDDLFSLTPCKYFFWQFYGAARKLRS